MVIRYWNKKSNFGDYLNKTLVEAMTGRQVFCLRDVVTKRDQPIYSVIGSVLDGCSASNLIVWGSGFKKSTSAMSKPPESVLAVRGPLTRQKLLDQGVDCPEIYGDPALLMPSQYDPSVQKRYSVGLIPHYNQKDSVPKEVYERDDKVVIDVEEDPHKIIRSIKSCDIILSSSLHGLIVADAYGISTKWVEFKSPIIKDRFKFYDYYKSISLHSESPINVENIRDIEKACLQSSKKRTSHLSSKLRAASPF